MRTVQEQTTESVSEAAPSPPRKINKVALTAGVLTIALVILGALWWQYAHGREETDDAYVEGHITYISSRISGTVSNVLIDEHQRIKKGDILVQLDPKDQQVEVNEAAASFAQAQHQQLLRNPRSSKARCLLWEKRLKQMVPSMLSKLRLSQQKQQF